MRSACSNNSRECLRQGKRLSTLSPSFHLTRAASMKGKKDSTESESFVTLA
jgi:hypothetical protein